MRNPVRPKTQKAALAEARAIIDSYPLNKPFAKKDVQRLTELSATPLFMATQRTNPLHPTAPRYVRVIHEKGGSEKDWSWPKAIQRAYSKHPELTQAKQRHAKVIAALRRAIQTDLDAFLHTQKNTACAHCGTSEKGKLTVDHLDPPFKVIADAFLSIHPAEQLFLIEVQGHSGFLASKFLEAEWRAFHKARAVLQILCRSHNSSKGAHA